MRIRELLKDEAAVEPTVMKLLAAVVLLAIGIGIAVTLYRIAEAGAKGILENIIENVK